MRMDIKLYIDRISKTPDHNLLGWERKDKALARSYQASHPLCPYCKDLHSPLEAATDAFDFGRSDPLAFACPGDQAARPLLLIEFGGVYFWDAQAINQAAKIAPFDLPPSLYTD